MPISENEGVGPEFYFNDYFKVDPSVLEDYGAFNISLITDLPLFIDPFLLFNSEKEEYQDLHDRIIDYIGFLRELSLKGAVDKGQINSFIDLAKYPRTGLGTQTVATQGEDWD